MSTTVTQQDTKPQSVADTLRAARALIEDPKHWTKRAYARPSKWATDERAPESLEAGAWCALGALRRIDGPYELSAISALSRVISGGTGTIAVWRFNDDPERRHRDILKVFDKAIALAEAQP